MNNITKTVLRAGSCVALTLLMFGVCPGCRTPQPAIVVDNVPKELSLGIDARDYDTLTRSLSESILSDEQIKLGKDKVLALGPIEDSSSMFYFDPVTFQERLSTLLHRSERISVTFVDKEIASKDALKARADIRMREWEKQSISDEEMMTLFGEISTVDYLLFGRLSTQTAQKGNKLEVVHRYNWKIGDCRTGLIVWTDEKVLTKVGKAISAKKLPEWAIYKRLDSPGFFYEFGECESAGSLEKAKQAAELNARRKLVTARLGRSESFITKFGVMEEVPLAIHPPNWSKGRLLVLYRYPKEKYDKILKQEKRAEDLNLIMSKARREFRLAEYAKARTSLNLVVKDYDPALLKLFGTHFDIEEAMIMLGDIELKGGNQMLKARRWYEKVKVTGSSKWKTTVEGKIKKLPPPPRFWPMNARLGDQNVALLCYIREGENSKRFGDLTSVLMQDCREADIKCFDLAKGLSFQKVENVFDTGDFSDISNIAGKKGAGSIIAVLADIDPSKRGKKVVQYGVEMPVIDTVVRFYVISTSNGSILYDGSLKAIAGQSSNDHLAKYSAAKLIENYLVPKCPSIK